MLHILICFWRVGYLRPPGFDALMLRGQSKSCWDVGGVMWLVQHGLCTYDVYSPSATSDAWLIRQEVACLDMLVLSEVLGEDGLDRRS
jgi:hypothetical protein